MHEHDLTCLKVLAYYVPDEILIVELQFYNIVEDQNYNTVVAAPQEKVYTTKYVFKKNIYEEEDTN